MSKISICLSSVFSAHFKHYCRKPVRVFISIILFDDNLNVLCIRGKLWVSGLLHPSRSANKTVGGLAEENIIYFMERAEPAAHRITTATMGLLKGRWQGEASTKEGQSAVSKWHRFTSHEFESPGRAQAT